MPIINSYTARSVKDGDEMLYTIKAMVSVWGKKKRFKLYRCAHPLTPNADAIMGLGGIPQGDRIHGTSAELDTIAQLLFPVLIKTGAIPDLS